MIALVLGSGAREHALVRSLQQDPSVSAVFAAPGNPGIAEIADCRALADITDAAAIVTIARSVSADLVLIGPEVPLVAGVADVLREAGFVVFGPSGAAAQLEGSKAFAKDVMAAADVPTARAYVCRDLSEAADALDATGTPYVVKDDGLAAGKGVVVTDDREAALAHAASCVAADAQVVIEEFLDGPEVSLFCLSDRQTVVPLAPAQDFKRVADNDEGPNTGGMGAYSPLDWAPDGLVEDVVRRVAAPTIREMARRGTPFVGVLYVGLALTSRGPRVIEFNARFGDPETQVVLQRLRTPLGQLLTAAATGVLDTLPALTWREDYAVTVVLASAGYPTAPQAGDSITIAEAGEGYLLHAGTALDANGNLVSAGGRVLCAVGAGHDLATARKHAYDTVAKVELAGSHTRSDIALCAQNGEITVPGTFS